MAWRRRLGPPRTFDKLAGLDINRGWAHDIERGDEQRTISVVVARSVTRTADLPDECRRAITSSGRTAVDAVLDRDEPPRLIVVTTAGLSVRDSIA